MKKIFVLLVVITFGLDFVLGQAFKESLLNNTIVKNHFSLVEEISLRKIVIPFDYNSATTQFDRTTLLKLPYRNIQKIEYVYSDNKDVAHQNKLNSDRIDTLTTLFKHRINRIYKNIELTTVAQIEGEGKRQLFNGFIITIEKSSRSNQRLINNVVTNSNKNKKLTACFNLDTLTAYGYILPHIKADNSGYEYKTIHRIFDRNSDWKKKLIVLDVTGSMTPYIAQYLLWLKLNFNPKEKQNFVFFNDGNGYKQTKKPIGSTGGLYFTQNHFGYDYILKTISKAILNGNCNFDIQENDIEAVLGGIQKFPESESIILIADNNAPPRDIKLIKELKLPVKVILCGTNSNGVQESYLNLAYETGGSVHTIESDLTNLMDKKEGAVFTFFGKQYKIKGGKVVLLYANNS